MAEHPNPSQQEVLTILNGNKEKLEEYTGARCEKDYCASLTRTYAMYVSGISCVAGHARGRCPADCERDE